MGRPPKISDEQIVAQMRKGVLMHGPHVSLELVARELEVTVPALLKRYGTRQALMLAALKPPDPPEWIADVRRGPDERPLGDQVLELMQRVFRYLEDAVPCLSALRESGIPSSAIFSSTSNPRAGLQALQRWMSMARRRGLITAPEVRTAAFAMLGALQTRVFFNHIEKRKLTERERRSYIEGLARLFTRALTP